MKCRVLLVITVLSSITVAAQSLVSGIEPNVLVSQAGIQATWPAIASGEKGLHIVWQDKGYGDYDILFQTSLNNGTTFSQPVVVNDNPGDGSHSSFPDVAVEDGRICVVWEDTRNVLPDIYFSQSFDGQSFLSDVPVWQSDVNSSARPSIALDKDSGFIYVAWVDDYLDIRASVSQDGGQSFSSPIMVSDSRKNGRYDPVIEVDSTGKVYVAWADGRTGLVQQGPFNVDDTDIFIANSTDQGQSFGQNTRVNKEYKGILQSHPSMAIDASDELHLVWDDELRYGEPSILYSRSADGFSFADSVFVNFTSWVSDGIGTVHQTPVVGLSGSGDLVYVSWAESRSGNYNIYLAKSEGDGFFPVVTHFGGDYFFDDILSYNGYRDPGEAVILDNGNGIVDPGRLDGSDSPDEVVLSGRANLQEDLSGETLLYFDENSDGWDAVDDIIQESPVLSYPSIEPKLKSEWDTTTDNFVNYLRLADAFLYEVEQSEVMSVGWFDIANAKDLDVNPENFGLENDDPVSRAEIEVTYMTDVSYDGTGTLNVSRGLASNVSIIPIANTGGAEEVSTVDLMSLGFRSIPDLKLLNVSFANDASSPSSVRFNKISLWIDRGLPGRYDLHDGVLYDGSSSPAFNDSLSSFVDGDDLMFLDTSMDGSYDLGEPLIVTSTDIDPGDSITSSEMVLPRAMGYWEAPFAPFPLNDDEGTSSQYSPAITVDRDGGCFAVWIDYRGAIASVRYADTVPDAWAPSVVDVLPAPSQTNVLLDTEIKMTFSEPVVRSSLGTAFRVFPPTAGEWNWSNDGTTATFRPLSGLLSEATYDVEILSSVIDLSGNPMRDRFRWEFTTAKSPSVTCQVNETEDAFSEIPILCIIADEWGVVSAVTYFRGVQEENYTKGNMSLVSGSGTQGSWMVTIPAQTYVGRVSYFVTGENVIGAKGRYPLYGDGAVDILDAVAPVLQHTPVTSASAGSIENLTVSASDDVGIERIMLYVKPIDGSAFVPREMHRAGQTDDFYFLLEIPNQNGRIEYFIKVIDVGGNEVTSPTNEPLASPHAIDVRGAADASVLFWIGLVAIIVVAIALLIRFSARHE